jgi:hypothetical protein
MVERGLKDPEVMFLKKEAHTSRKMSRGAYRLIWVQSQVDAVVQLLLHDETNQIDKALYQSAMPSHSMVGLGHDDNGLDLIRKILLSKGGRVGFGDARHFDLTLTRCALMADTLRRICYTSKLYFIEDEGGWEQKRIMQTLLWTHGLLNSTHMLDVHGELWECCSLGVTASGIQSTSYQNSFVRSFLARLCGATWALSLGDDLLYGGNLDHDLMRQFGIDTKPDSVGSADFAAGDAVDFTSHLISLTGAEFLNINKLCARLLLDYENTDKEIPFDVLCGTFYVTRHTSSARASLVDVLAYLEVDQTKFLVAERVSDFVGDPNQMMDE